MSKRSREVVRFEPNVPQQMALKRDGVPSGDGKVCYELTDGRTLLLELDVAARLADELQLNLGESFWICLRWDGKPETAPYFELWLDPQTEKKRAREETSELEKQLEASLAMRNIQWSDGQASSINSQQTARGAQRRLRTQTTESAASSSSSQTGNVIAKKEPTRAPNPSGLLTFEELLIQQATILANTYAACLKRATKAYGGAISREDIRTFVVTAYISQTQRGRGFWMTKGHAA
jgi:hypothetical protein